MHLTTNESFDETSTQNFEKLPTIARPINYKILLKPNLKTFKFYGEETIQIYISEHTNFLKLHSCELDIHNVSSTLCDGTKFQNLSYTYDNTLEMVKINFPKQISPQIIKLHLTFTGIHNDKMKGFYRSTYKTPNSEKKYIVTTQFESTYARMSFPCFDELIYKAIFDISLQVDNSLTALSNMEEIETKDMKDGTKLVKYAPSIKMSPHLVAFAVGDFEYIEGKNKNGTIVRVYTLPGKTNHGTSALEIGIKSLDYFNEWFDFDYPLSKMDMLAVPDFTWGAMENTGLLIFREAALLIDPSITSVYQKSCITIIIAHEIAHQWFGNLVTPVWWDQLWLKEGFASFMPYLMIDLNYPDFNIWEKFLKDEVSCAFALDSLRSTHPIEVPIDNPSELEEIYDAITYKKSDSVLRMLYFYLGEKTFQKALRNYIKKYQYNNTDTKDLWEALSEVSGENIQEMMDTWTKQVGYPLVSVKQVIEGNKRFLTLSQTRYIGDGVKNETSQLWHIPITISTALSNGQPKYNFFMTKETQTFIIEDISPSQWIKLNTGVAGFYRVEYSNDMLDSLITGIQNKTLPVLDRFGIANDMFALVRVGKLDGAKYLKLFEASVNEEEYVVRNILDEGIEILSNVLSRFENGDVVEKFNAFVIKNMESLGAKLGWNAKEGEDGRIFQLRALVLNRLASCGHKPTIDTARKIFYDHYKNKKDIDPNLRNLIYSVVGKKDGAEGIKKLQEIFETINFSEVEISCIIGMAQTTDIKLLESVFDYGINKNKIRIQDLAYLFAGAASNKVGQDFVFKYFLNNVELIIEKYGSSNSSIFQKCLKVSAEGVASDSLATEFENFFKYNLNSVDQSTLDRPIKQTAEIMRNNYQILKLNGDSIYKFLSSQNL